MAIPKELAKLIQRVRNAANPTEIGNTYVMALRRIIMWASKSPEERSATALIAVLSEDESDPGLAYAAYNAGASCGNLREAGKHIQAGNCDLITEGSLSLLPHGSDSQIHDSLTIIGRVFFTLPDAMYVDAGSTVSSAESAVQAYGYGAAKDDKNVGSPEYRVEKDAAGVWVLHLRSRG
ncbi:hypothetical protein AB0F42_06300 [Streptomyces buecherae]|uniref:hypothetical protein n=1 Tax=Streptomyces buecherae TaxID=2763006 RepID=UPI0034118268